MRPNDKYRISNSSWRTSDAFTFHTNLTLHFKCLFRLIYELAFLTEQIYLKLFQNRYWTVYSGWRCDRAHMTVIYSHRHSISVDQIYLTNVKFISIHHYGNSKNMSYHFDFQMPNDFRTFQDAELNIAVHSTQSRDLEMFHFALCFRTLIQHNQIIVESFEKKISYFGGNHFFSSVVVDRNAIEFPKLILEIPNIIKFMRQCFFHIEWISMRECINFNNSKHKCIVAINLCFSSHLNLFVTGLQLGNVLRNVCMCVCVSASKIYFELPSLLNELGCIRSTGGCISFL